VQFAAASLAAFDGNRPHASHAAAFPDSLPSGQWYFIAATQLMVAFKH
jgi:hypothetical protein